MTAAARIGRPGEVRQAGRGPRDGATGRPPLIHGYAAVFNTLSVPLIGDDGGRFRERFRPGAFAALLRAGPDVPAVIDHDAFRALGSTAAGSVRLREDSRGLCFEIDPPAGAFGLFTAERVRRRDLTGCSLTFVPGVVAWRHEGGERVREVQTVRRLDDITLTDSPAYRRTAVGLLRRGAEPGEARRSLHLLLTMASL